MKLLYNPPRAPPALEEGGVNGAHGLEPLHRETGGEGDGVLLGDSHVQGRCTLTFANIGLFSMECERKEAARPRWLIFHFTRSCFFSVPRSKKVGDERVN